MTYTTIEETIMPMRMEEDEVAGEEIEEDKEIGDEELEGEEKKEKKEEEDGLGLEEDDETESE